MQYQFNKFVFCFLLCFIFIVTCCSGDGEKIKELLNPDEAFFFAIDKTIVDYFPEYYNKFDLSNNEILLIGEWIEINRTYDAYVSSYTFFPNKTILVVLDNYDPLKSFRVRYGNGIWKNVDNVIYVKIKYITLYEPSLKKDRTEFVDWKWQKVINLDFIHSDGYTLYPFKSIRLPRNLEAKMGIKPNYKSQYMFRSFGQPDVLNPGKWLMNQLDITPFLAKFYPDGTHIYDNEETYHEYMEKQYKVSNGELTID